MKFRVLLLLSALCACTEAWAGVEIKLDMEGGTVQMRNNIFAFLSLSRYVERKDLELETVERLSARIPLEVGKALEPLGYYEPAITYNLKSVKDDASAWQVQIHVELGRSVKITDVNVSVEGEGEQDERIRLVLNKAAVLSGQRLDHGLYDAYKEEILRAANRSGYLDAHWLENDLLIDTTERRASISLKLETGSRYYFGQINIEQSVIDEELMQRFIRMRQGQPYDVELLLQTQYVLDDTLYFSTVDVVGGVPDPVTHTVSVSIVAQANKKNSYAIAAGYGTDTQQRGRLSWDRRLINRAGHSAKLEIIGSTIGHQVGVHYVIPVRDVALEKLEFTVLNTKEELADVTSYRDEFKAGLTQALGTWQRVLFVELLNEQSKYESTQDTNFLVIPGVSYATLPSFLLGHERRDYSVSIQVKGSPSSLGSGASFVQFIGQGEKIFSLDEMWHVRLRGSLGASWLPSSDFSELPASVRFFAGGDNSVRGYGLNELSPLDSAGQRVGARNLVVGTIELERELPKNLRGAVFYDIGNAIDRFGDTLKDSAGIGVRWHISVASLGLDLAQPISENGRGPRLHLHLSTLF